jgi:hypothetical protein
MKKVINELDYNNIKISKIIYYYGKDDPDQKEILDNQNSNKTDKLHLEFPLRIQETIKPF